MENDNQDQAMRADPVDQPELITPPVDSELPPTEPPITEYTPPVKPMPTVQTAPIYTEPPKPAGKSLRGLGGALVFWIIALGVGGLSWIGAFFIALSGSFNSPSAEISETIIFGLILAVLYIGTLVAIVLTKQIAVWLAYVSLVVTATYFSVIAITGLATYSSSCLSRYYSRGDCDLTPETIVAAVGGIVSAWVAAGLVALYFWRSQRVKQTLVN
jgi:hypothetical protein